MNNIQVSALGAVCSGRYISNLNHATAAEVKNLVDRYGKVVGVVGDNQHHMHRALAALKKKEGYSVTLRRWSNTGKLFFARKNSVIS